MAGSGLTCLDAHILLSLDPMMLKYAFGRRKKRTKKNKKFRSKFERNKNRAILTTNSDKSLTLLFLFFDTTSLLCHRVIFNNKTNGKIKQLVRATHKISKN